EGHRSVAQRLSVEPDRRQGSGRSVSLPDLRRQVSDRLRRAAAAHDVRGQNALGHQGGADALAPQPRASAEARCLRARFHERQRYHSRGIRRLLPDGYQVYAAAQINELVSLYLNGADRDRLDPILDACVAIYREHLDEDGQVDFKGKAKAFTRTYGFLSQVLPYTNAEWEKLSIFLTFLVPKLPAPIEEDLSKGILEAIDMDSYRVEKQAAVRIQLPDADAEIEPVPAYGGGRKPEPELDRLSNILKTFNDQFGNIQWTDKDRVQKLITEEIPARVSADTAYQNAKKNSDRQNARIEHDKALQRVIVGLMKDDT